MMHLLHLFCFPSLCSSQYSHAFISQEEDSSLVQADDLLMTGLRFRADVQAAGCRGGGVCGVWCAGGESAQAGATLLWLAWP